MSLQIKVGADIREAVQALNIIEKELNETGNVSKQMAAKLNDSFQRVQTSLGKTSNVFNKASSEGRRFNNTTLEMGRVIQDLPYGFQGIQNNLTQLIPAVGGLGLGFSALISAITFSQIGFRNWSRGVGGSTDEAKKKVEEIKKTVEELTRPLNEIKLRIGADVAGDTDAEIIKVNSLSKVITDVTKNYKERNRALEQLKDINKNYFGDLTLEASSLKLLTGRVEEYTKALVASSVVKAFSDEIGKVGKELSQQQGKLSELRQQLNAIAGDYQLVGKNAKGLRLLTPQQNVEVAKLNTQIKEQEGLVFALGNTYKKLQGQVESAILETLTFKPLDTDNKGGKDANKELEKMLEERRRIIAEFQKDFAALKVFSLPDIGDPKQNEELRKRLQDALDTLIVQKLPEIAIKIKLEETAKKNFETELNKILKAPSKAPIGNNTDQSLKLESDDFEKKGKEMGKRFGAGFDEVIGKQFKEAFQKALESGLDGKQLQKFKDEFAAATFIGLSQMDALSEAFGAFTDSVLKGENAMQSLANSLRNSIRALIVELVKAVIQAAILSALSGGTTSFASAFGKVLGFSKGGIVPGSGNGDTVPALLTPGELVIPKDQVAKVTKLLKGSVSLELPENIFGSLNINSSLNQLRKLQSFNFNIPHTTIPRVRNTDVQSPLGNLQKALSGLAIQNNQSERQLVAKVAGKDLLFVVEQAGLSNKRNFGR
jgi:archaellum component FlaC